MITERIGIIDDAGHDVKIHVERDLVIPDREERAPDVLKCRYAVLQVVTGYVVYDRLLSRIVDGVYHLDASDALGVAQWFNESPESAEESKPPNGDAMRLIYPEQE